VVVMQRVVVQVMHQMTVVQAPAVVAAHVMMMMVRMGMGMARVVPGRSEG
jgi:hypothetical protein